MHGLIARMGLELRLAGFQPHRRLKGLHHAIMFRHGAGDLLQCVKGGRG